MLWGGRFSASLNQTAFRFSSSFTIDQRLISFDILGSKAHATMLQSIGILTNDELQKIISGLSIILSEWDTNSWRPDPEKTEDIHSAIESRLKDLIGEPAGKLHTGRSRNDQVITAVKLWTKNAIDELIQLMVILQKELLAQAEKHTETIIPGYTHLQRAQPISFGYHLMTYVYQLERDKNRLLSVKKLADISPLGSGAIAGSTIPLDRELTAQLLNFYSVCGHTMDAISDRDFMLDFLHAASLGMIHLSRLSEEIILWSTTEWKLITLSDEWTTGSSLMPQKKNPDMAELIRGKSGRTAGNYISLTTTLKGLPLSYNRDLQEDKEPLFDSFDTWADSLQMMSGMIQNMTVHTERFIQELEGDFSLATDFADALVLKGIPFRTAHHITGELVQLAEKKKVNLHQLTFEDLQTILPTADATLLSLFSISDALFRKKTTGSPNPDLVKKDIDAWKVQLS